LLVPGSFVLDDSSFD